MICKILSGLVLAGLLFLSEACQQKAHEIPISYKEKFPIDTIIPIKTYTVEDVTQPSTLTRMGDRVLAMGNHREAALYSYPGLEFVKKVTIPIAASVTFGDGYFHSETGGNVDTYVLRNDSFCKTSSFVIAKVPKTICTVQELAPGIYVYPDLYNLPGRSEFHIMDINRGKCVSKGRYPEYDDSRFKSLEDFKRAYAHGVQLKPDKSAFVVIYVSLKRIRIYDKDGELQHDVFLEGSSGNYKVIPTRISEQYWHFLNVETTDNYIYLSNLDRLGVAPTAPRSNILVLDWKGNLIAKYRFNVSLSSFFVDEERNVIYGCCWEKERGKVFFTMNMLNYKYRL